MCGPNVLRSRQSPKESETAQLLTYVSQGVMKTIFHFNCVVCGAHLPEQPIEDFSWPPSAERMRQLLAALRWILPNVWKTRRGTPDFQPAVEVLLQSLPPYEATPLHEFRGPATIFIAVCPLCGMPPGERPDDHYFCAWFAWNLLCRAQVENLLYEMAFLLQRDPTTRSLPPHLERAIAALELDRCKCGRATTAIDLEGRCRWCADGTKAAERRVAVRTGEDEGEPQTEEDDADSEHSFTVFISVGVGTGWLDAGFSDFLESMKDCDLLSAGPEAWEAVRTGLVCDIRERHSDGMSRLVAALIGHRIDTWLEPWRSLLAKENRWPGGWNVNVLQTRPAPPPQGTAEAWRTYQSLPREVLESLRMGWLREWPPAIEAVLEAKGLLVLGAADDFAGYLRRLPIASVREVSNRLGAGRGRSKEEVISKIVGNATPEEITAVIPEIRQRWVKAVHGPFDLIPREWMEYAERAAPLVLGFIRDKFQSKRALAAAREEKEQASIHVDSECPAYCSELADQFSIDRAADLRNVPPWFPGCGCTIQRAGFESFTPGAENAAVGTVVTVEEDTSTFVRVEPCGLYGQFAVSPNRRFRLIWSQGEYHNRRNHGWYLLVEDDRVAVFGKMEGPDKGEVADDGTFVLVDSTSREDRQEIFSAFDRTGNVLIRQPPTENIQRIAVSKDGRHAAYDSPGDTFETSTVTCIDLEARSVISRFECRLTYSIFDSAIRRILRSENIESEAGRLSALRRISRFQIDSEAGTVGVVSTNGQVFRYSFKGQLLDAEAWQATWLKQADGYQLLQYVQQQLVSEWRPGSELEFVDLLKRALEIGVSVYTQGVVHSMMGEIYERAGRLDEAVNMYEAAVRLAPNLPLKRKLKALKAK